MQALVKRAAGPGLELCDVPEPPMSINDVRIRVRRTGICGTDLHIADWDAWAERTIEPPLVVGHEFVGEVLEVGSNVKDIAPGDIVSGEGHVVCGRCRHCRAGRWHLCAKTVGLGVQRDGAFAEQVVLPVTNVWHHWPGIDEDVAAIFDPFGNAVHTALAFPVLGEDVLVVGAGPIGLMATAVARHAGARFIVVSEPNAFRRELASRMGATLTVDPAARDLRDVQAELGMVEGFDVVIEMSGHPGAFRDYVWTTLWNAVRDIARGAKRRGPIDPIDTDLEADAPSPLQVAMGRETFDRYEAAMERLRPEEREAIIARVELGLSHAEVAQALGKPSAAAAHMAVSRALMRLAAEMAHDRKHAH